MYETLSRPHEISHAQLPTIGQVSQKLKTAEIRKEEKRIAQITTAKITNANRKRKRAGGKDEEECVQPENEGAVQLEKKTKTHGDTLTVMAPGYTPTSSSATSLQPESIAVLPDTTNEVDPALPPTSLASTLISPTIVPSLLEPDNATPQSPIPKQTRLPSTSALSRPFPEVRGHTSYLTFACLIPSYPQSPAHQVDNEKTKSPTAITENCASSDFQTVISFFDGVLNWSI